VAAFADAAHALIERACLWSAEDCRCVVRAVQAALQSFEALRAVTLALAAATRDARPGALSAETMVAIRAARPPRSAGEDAAVALHEHVVASVAQHGKVWLTGRDTHAYDANLRETHAHVRLRRLVQLALAPKDTWRPDPAALPAGLSKRDYDALSTPRATAAALCSLNGPSSLIPNDAHFAAFEELCAKAEAAGEAQTGWLPSCVLDVAPGVRLCCRDCYARDPLHGVTTFATIATLH